MKTGIFIAALLLATTSFSQVTLDSTFGINGIVRTATPNSSEIFALAIQIDERIVVAGISPTSPIYHFQIARYLPNGDVDTSFGLNGFVNTEIQNASFPTDLLIQGDGKIVVAGFTGAPNKNIMVRYLANGTLDSTFGGTGVVLTAIPSSTNHGISEIALQPDGKIVAGGWANAINQFLVMRFLDNGTLDTSFGQGGLVKTSLQTSSSIVSIALQNDGKIVAGGVTSTGYPSANFALVRYNTDGSLDTTFGVAGKVITDVYSFGDGDDGVNSLKIQSDNKIITGGFAGGFGALARYNDNGSLDTSFNTNGIVIMNSTTIPVVADLELQTDDKILVISTSFSRYNIARFDNNGSIDPNFGNSGQIIIDIPNNPEFAQCLAIQSDNKIVIGGSSRSLTTGLSEFTLVRLNNDINVGLNEVQNMDNQILAYPNPASNWLNISLENKKYTSGKIKIALFDVLGNLVLSENRILGNEPLTLNVTSVRNGSYVLHITFADGSTDVFKVSVNR